MSSHEIDTIVLGVPCTIQYDYQPYEAPERGIEARYPGCEESVEVASVIVGGVCNDEWIDCHMQRNFEEAVIEHINRQRELKEENEYESFDEYEEATFDYYS